MEFAEEFDILQSAVMHIYAEGIDAEVEDMTADPYDDCGDIADGSEHIDEDIADLIDGKSDDAGRQSQSEKTGIREDIAEDIDGAVKVAENTADHFEHVFLAEARRRRA